MRVFVTRLYYDFFMSHVWKKSKRHNVSYSKSNVTARDGYAIPTRIYRPNNLASEKLPVIIFYHGGGFVIGSLKGYHNLLSALCEMTQSIVVSMEYRLAPEYPYPVPMQDAFDVSTWVLENTEQLNIGNKFILAGDSAGGNLAAVISHTLKNDERLKGQLLICPVTDQHLPEKGSFVDNAKVGPLTAGMMKWFTKHYTQNGFESEDVNIFPLKNKDFTGLPPALVYTAELDVLRDDGNEYVEKLKQAGVQTLHIEQAAEVHNFPIAKHKSDNTIALQVMKNSIKECFST